MFPVFVNLNAQRIKVSALLNVFIINKMKKLIISFVCMIAFIGYSQTIKVVDAADLSPVSRVVIQA